MDTDAIEPASQTIQRQLRLTEGATWSRRVSVAICLVAKLLPLNFKHLTTGHGQE